MITNAATKVSPSNEERRRRGQPGPLPPLVALDPTTEVLQGVLAWLEAEDARRRRERSNQARPGQRR